MRSGCGGDGLDQFGQRPVGRNRRERVVPAEQEGVPLGGGEQRNAAVRPIFRAGKAGEQGLDMAQQADDRVAIEPAVVVQHLQRQALARRHDQRQRVIVRIGHLEGADPQARQRIGQRFFHRIVLEDEQAVEDGTPGGKPANFWRSASGWCA